MSDERGRDRDGRGLTRKQSSRSPSTRGEFDFIKRIRRQELKLPTPQPASSSRTRQLSPLITHPSSLVLGIGDDAAVVRPRAGFDTVITADLLVEGIDFDLERFPATPRDLGRRALVVSLSDIAAMGARPTACLLSIGVPTSLWRGNFLAQFYAGVRSLARRYGVRIIGGDTSRTPERVVIDSIVLGEVRRGRAVTRAGARPGDQLFVTGALGGAAAGLRILQRRAGARATSQLTPAERRLVRRQIRPEPRVEWGRLLGERRLATALIDLSDGLSSDLAHLCRESGTGARVEAAWLPFDRSLKSLFGDDTDALTLALNGGEDFELLFSVRPRDVSKLPREVGGVPVTHIGEVTGERGKVRLIRDGRARLLRPGGFEHFKSKSG